MKNINFLLCILLFLFVLTAHNFASADQKLANIMIDHQINHLEIDPQRNKLYAIASNPYDSNMCTVIDLGTNRIIETFDFPPELPFELLPGDQGFITKLNPANNKLYLLTADEKIRVFDLNTRSIIKTIDFEGRVYSPIINSVSNELIVGIKSSPSMAVEPIAIIDSVTDTITRKINTTIIPYNFSLDPQANLLYISDNSGGNSSVISILDLSSGNVTGEIRINDDILDIDTGPNTIGLYALSFEGHKLYVIDTVTRTVLDKLVLAKDPRALKVFPQTNKIYVVTEGNFKLSVINGFTNEIIEKFNAKTPYYARFQINPQSNRLYVSYFKEIDVYNSTPSVSSSTPRSLSNQVKGAIDDLLEINKDIMRSIEHTRRLILQMNALLRNLKNALSLPTSQCISRVNTLLVKIENKILQLKNINHPGIPDSIPEIKSSFETVKELLKLNENDNGTIDACENNF